MQSSKNFVINQNSIAITTLWLIGILNFVENFELIYVILLVIAFLFLGFSGVVKYSIVSVVIPLIYIVGISLLGILLYHPKAFDVFKDFAHLTKPIISIVAGYYCVNALDDKNDLVRFLIRFALFAAIYHLFLLLINIGNMNFSVQGFRNVGGKGNDFELFGFCLLLFSNSIKEWRVFSRNAFFWALTVIGVSLMLYFSRTMWVGFVIFIMAFLGYTKITHQQSLYLVLILGLVVGFITVLQFTPIPRTNAKGETSFLYKMKMAPQEILNPKIDKNNHVQLWDRWRAYEANRAIETVNEGGVPSILFGRGMGSLVDLELYVKLGPDEMRFVPHIHNGYAYIYLKSGLVGLFMYFIWLMYLFSKQYSVANNRKMELILYGIAGFGLYYVFTTLVITGIYNILSVFPFILGGWFSLYDQNK